jgi:UDP-2-acetamido-3-amino-2,3-dideoxy-glucuronate N-acetyltransferase
VVHGATVIGDAVRVGAGAVLGKPPRLSPRSRAPREVPPPLEVADGVEVGPGAVVLAGARLAAGARLGAGAHVRERARIGPDTTIGPGAAVDNDVPVGAGVAIGSGSYLTAGSTVEDAVSVGEAVITANDNTMGRHPAGGRAGGVTLRGGCRVGDRAVLLPGVEIGADAVVDSESVVISDVPARARAAGVPARLREEIA